MTNKDEKILSTIEKESNPFPTSSIIWLHGLGADGNDFVPIVDELKLPKHLAVRFIFPHAPVVPITINNGYPMRAWFDISILSFHAQVDEMGITKSVQSVEKLIEQEVARGIPAKQIILAGFSQGAVVALYTALPYKESLGGVLALSGFLPLANQLLAKPNKANQNIPIFMAHGTDDPIVPYPLGKSSSTALIEAGYPVSWHSYPMGHSVCAPEINDISQWLKRVLLPSNHK